MLGLSNISLQKAKMQAKKARLHMLCYSCKHYLLLLTHLDKLDMFLMSTLKDQFKVHLKTMVGSPRKY